jgi:uncharacterized membrane protein
MTLTRWSALLGALGLVISLYLAGVHFAQGLVPLACSAGGLVNCEQVISSAESTVGPVPVAVLGVAWFVVFLSLLAIRVATPYRLAWTASGLAFVFYLIYAELFLIGALCLWCTAVHLTVIGLFLLAVAETSSGLPGAYKPGADDDAVGSHTRIVVP